MADKHWDSWRTTVAILFAAFLLTLLLVVLIDWVPHH
jgi:hypothetical protein